MIDWLIATGAYSTLGKMFAVAVLCGGVGWAAWTDDWFLDDGADSVPVVFPWIILALLTWPLWPVVVPVLLTVVLALRLRARREQRKLRDAEVERILKEPL